MSQGTAPHAHQPISIARKLIYGAGQGAPGLTENTISFFLLFYYVTIVQMDPKLVGLAMMIGRLWDAFTDPLMGYISDQTRVKLGRRRFYIIFGAVPFGLCFTMLWTPFLGVQGNAAFPFLLVLYPLYTSSLTVCQVPYLTLGGEMSPDYHERSSIIGFRQIYWTLAIFVGASTNLIAQALAGGTSYADPSARQGWIYMAAVIGLSGAIAWLIAGLGTREPVTPGPRDAKPVGEALVDVFRATGKTLLNKHFLIVGVVFLTTQIAFTLITSTLPFLVNHWMRMPKALTPVMVALLLMTLPFLAIWVRVSRYTGKRVAYVLGLATMGTFSILTLWMLNPERGAMLMYIQAACFGIGLASHFVFPWAIVPDVCDEDELHTGERRDGSYFGAMTFLAKSSAAVSIQLSGLLLSAIGFDGSLEVQSEHTVQGLRYIYALIPGAAFFVAAGIMSLLPMTEATANAVRRQLQERRATAV